MIIYYAHVNGFGDKLLGLVSAYLLAKILNTRFRIHWIQPFPLSEILCVKSEDWHFRDYEIVHDEHNSIVGCVIIKEDSGNETFDLIQTKINNNENVVIDCIYPYYVYLFNTFYDKYDFIKEISVVENTIKYVFDKLFKIPKAIEKKLIDGNKTLGVQIRTLLRIDYDIPKISMPCLANFLESAKLICEQNNLNTIYLSSDINYVLDNFPQEFTYVDNNNITQTVKIISSDGQCKHIFYENFTDSKDKIKIILDIINLSRCDELLISHWSNYGRISSFLGLKNPYVIPFEINIDHDGTLKWYNEKLEQGVKDCNVAFGVSLDLSTNNHRKINLCELLTKSCV